MGHRLIGSVVQEENLKNSIDSLRLIGPTPKFRLIGSKCSGTKVTRLSGVDCIKKFHSRTIYTSAILIHWLSSVFATIINAFILTSKTYEYCRQYWTKLICCISALEKWSSSSSHAEIIWDTRIQIYFVSRTINRYNKLGTLKGAPWSGRPRSVRTPVARWKIKKILSRKPTPQANCRKSIYLENICSMTYF